MRKLFKMTDITVMEEKNPGWSLWILFTASFTPIPYGMFSLSAGAFGINFMLFCLATITSQTIKFFMLAFISRKLGQQFKNIFEYKMRPFIVIAAVCIALAVLVR